VKGFTRGVQLLLPPWGNHKEDSSTKGKEESPSSDKGKGVSPLLSGFGDEAEK